MERDSGKAVADGVLTGAVHPTRSVMEKGISFRIRCGKLMAT
jgi:hypothetical protein